MREELLSILERLIKVRETLGEASYELACHRTRHAIALVVLSEAERRARRDEGTYERNH